VIARRELTSFFVSPIAYVVATTFLLVFGFLFQSIVTSFSDPRSPGGDVFPRLFANLFTWIVLFLYCATLTMRLIAEERRSGSLESLMTSPLSEWQVVVGKFLGALGFYLFLWAPTVVYVFLLARHTRVDPGPILAGYLGVALVGAFFLAVGTFASAVSRSQVAAAILGFTLCVLLFATALFFGGLAADPGWQAFWGHLSLTTHMAEFGRGIVDSRRVIFLVSCCAFFLFLATRVLSLRNWR